MIFVLQRRELLACAPTGSGKTAAFILPVLAHLKVHCSIGYVVYKVLLPVLFTNLPAISRV